MRLHSFRPAEAHKEAAVRNVCKPVVAARGGLRSLAPRQQGGCRRDVQAGVATVGRTSNSNGGEAPPHQQKYDVWVEEPTPLKEGEEKHVISIFVADESGLINRVAGVFGRRGANIESLAVGTTVNKALFTIVMTGTASAANNLVKQLSKLVSVKYVEDITKSRRIEREMILIKLRASHGAERTDVLQLAQIFRAKVNDVSDDTLTLCISGDPGKCAAVQKVLSRYEVLEIARTGRICLKRGDQRLDAQHPMMSYDEIYQDTTDEESSSSDAVAAAAGGAASPNGEASGTYRVNQADMARGWQSLNPNLLEPTYDSKLEFSAEHTLTIEVRDMPGVLNQVTGVFARRGYNVASLAVGPCEKQNVSRICMVVPGNEDSIQKLFKQLSKLVWVNKMTDLTHSPMLYRELMLVKVRCTPNQLTQLRNLEQIFRGSILDVSPTTCTIEIVGKEDKLKALTDCLEPYGILEIARTGRIAMLRESGVDSTYLTRMATTKVF